MKKKFACSALILFLMLGMFVGCSGNSSTQSAGGSSTAAADDTTVQDTSGAAADSATTYKIAFLPGDMANESQAYSAKQFEKLGSQLGFDVTILDGRGDAQVQAQTVSNCIAQDMDVIFINPNDVNGIVPSLMEAKESGIIIGLFSSDLPEEFAASRNFFVGVNDNMAGETAAQAFINHFPSGAKIVEVGGQAGHDAQIKRHDGFDAIIKSSSIEVIDSQSVDTWSTSEAMAIMEDLIVKHGNEIEGVFCHWDNGATGIIEALNAANMENIYVIAVDGCRAGFDQVESGKQSVTIMQNFTTMTQKSLEVALAALNGETYEPINYVPLDAVSKDNISDFEYPEW